jgi:hypothetical protein
MTLRKDIENYLDQISLTPKVTADGIMRMVEKYLDDIEYASSRRGWVHIDQMKKVILE